MSNQKLLNRLRVLPVATLDEKKPGRYVMSVSDLLKMIQKAEPSVDISPLGETDFIITYQTPSAASELFRKVKIFFVCLASFFGAAFSIMTFNNDVDIQGLFSDIYQLFTGQTSDGFTVLELSYSFGLGIGIILFFNHFAGKRIETDPTPLDVQMHTYEQDVNQTIMSAYAAREQQKEQ